MTRTLPFTEASVARAIKGVKRSGHFVVGVKPDGTLIVAEKPIDITSLSVPDTQPSLPAENARRMGDYFHGGSSEAQGA